MSEAAAALVGTWLALELLPEACASCCWLPAGRPEMRLSPLARSHPLDPSHSLSLSRIFLSLPPLWTPIQTASIETLLKRCALARLCRLGRPWSHPAGGLCVDGGYSGGHAADFSRVCRFAGQGGSVPPAHSVSTAFEATRESGGRSRSRFLPDPPGSVTVHPRRPPPPAPPLAISVLCGLADSVSCCRRAAGYGGGRQINLQIQHQTNCKLFYSFSSSVYFIIGVEPSDPAAGERLAGPAVARQGC